MRNLQQLTNEEILFIIECIQTYNSLNNENGEYDDIIETITEKLN
tara:strand:+ start:792 stop:926 length:135 start_codon:yes stop_codon:yes gene_type:complete